MIFIGTNYFHPLAPPGHSCYQLGQERSVRMRERGTGRSLPCEFYF